jgi:hypothetical protein
MTIGPAPSASIALRALRRKQVREPPPGRNGILGFGDPTTTAGGLGAIGLAPDRLAKWPPQDRVAIRFGCRCEG